MLYAITHNTIPIYGLCMMCGILVASAYAGIRCVRNGEDIDTLLIIIAASLCGGFIGAKILYLHITYDSIGEIVEEMQRLGIKALLGDGLVFYGGMIGGITAGSITAHLLNRKLQVVYCILVPCIPLAHSFGRIGCWFAGCCCGKIGGFLPVQIVEAVIDIVLALFLIGNSRGDNCRRKGEYWLLKAYLILYACFRFLLEYFRTDAIRGKWKFFSTSQWLSILVILVCALHTLYEHSKAEV